MKITHIFIFIIGIIIGFKATNAQEKKEATDTAAAKSPVRVAELDQFHKLLHPLIHDAYPNKDFATIRKALPDLVQSAEIMAKATLPQGIKEDQYRKKAQKLVKELKAMEKKKEKLSDKKLGKDFMKMHDTFEGIMQLMP